MFGFTKTRKKTFKYRVTVKGVAISKHYTKKAANDKSRSIRGAKVVKIGGRSTTIKSVRRTSARRKTTRSRRY